MIKNENNNEDIKHIIISGDSSWVNLVLRYILLIIVKEFEPIFQNNNFIFPMLVLAQYPVNYVKLKIILIVLFIIEFSFAKYKKNEYMYEEMMKMKMKIHF